MKSIGWLVVGFVIGAVGMWAYSAYVMAPNAAADARAELLAAVEAEKLAQEKFVTGTVTKNDEETGTVTLIAAAGPNQEGVAIEVTTDEKTVVTSEEFGPIKVENLGVGSHIMVVSDQAIGNRTTLYATEIILY